MSTLQNTISMIEVLPEADLLKIQDFAKKLSKRRESESMDEAVAKFLGPKSPEDFMKDIETAEKQYAAGKYSSAEEVFNELEQRYGF